MKTLIFIILCFSAFKLNAQNSCSNPDTIATGQTYIKALPINAGNAPAGPNYSCLASQVNPLWMFVEICQPGNMTISMDSQSSANDIDFICWGPVTGISNLTDLCTQVSTGTIAVEDCSFSTAGVEYCDITNALGGEFYLIMVTNYSNQPGNVTVSQISGTAITCDSAGLATQFCGNYNLPPCEVTMNDSSNRCKILWEKIAGLAVDQYYIYRLNANSVYDLIDSIPENDSSFYIDYSSNPSTQPYRYKLGYKDTCGDISSLSGYHQSIHLQVMPGFNSVNLDWDSYIGLSFPTYYIMRGTDPFNMNIIDSVSSAFTSFTDFNAIPSEPYYQVGFVNPDPCEVTRSPEMLVVSNVFNIGTNGIEEITTNDFVIQPNPAEDLIYIHNKMSRDITTISISDITGRKIKEWSDLNNSSEQLDISEISVGSYLLIIHSQGKQVVQKLIIR